MKAIWNGEIVAQSDNTVVIEGNHYFPEESLNEEFFIESSTSSVCPWKGVASYKTLCVKGEENVDAAWYYPETSKMAASIKGRFAFWKGVEIAED